MSNKTKYQGAAIALVMAVIAVVLSPQPFTYGFAFGVAVTCLIFLEGGK